MGLIEFVKDREIKELFRREFKMPAYKISHKIRAPPLTDNYRLIGRAFDYLLKEYVKYNNVREDHRYNHYLKIIYRVWKTDKFIDISFEDYNLMLEGIVPDSILKGSIIAAHVSWKEYYKIDEINYFDIEDLRNLINIVKINEFKSNYKCIVNSILNDKDNLVRGAICDIILDDKLIDIKTSMNLSIDEDTYYQIIGYYILSIIQGRHNINEVGIYFARYGVLYLYKIKELVELDNIQAIIDEFKEIARNKYGT